MKERLRIQGLRKRWILNSVGPVILILVLAAILASATVANNYYGSARSTLEAKAKAGADYFNSYSMSSYSEYYRNASLYAASFDSTRIELQFLNLYGRVDNSTQGVAAGTAPQTPEIARALESGSIEVFSGKDPVTGESVMAVTTPLKFNGSTVAFMRYVTATRQIDHQILLTILIISAIIAGVICLVLISSLLFINSVVAPVAEVTDAAKRISGGSYGIQLPNPYTDEMGELVDNINDMSLKISQSEKIQTEFISSVSHELRTPLTAINGWSGDTDGEDDDPAELRQGSGHHYPQGIPPTDQHGGGAAGVLPDAGRAFYPPHRARGPRRRSLRTPFTPIRSCSDRRASELQLRRRRTSCLRPYPRRSGTAASRCSATCWTTPPSTAAPASASIASLRREADNYVIRIRDYRPRHPRGGAALCEAEVLQGLLQGPWQRHRPGGVR